MLLIDNSLLTGDPTFDDRFYVFTEVPGVISDLLNDGGEILAMNESERRRCHLLQMAFDGRVTGETILGLQSEWRIGWGR